MTTVRRIAGRIVFALGLLVYAIGPLVGGTPAIAGVTPEGEVIVAAAAQQEGTSCRIEYAATSCAYSCAAHCSQALDDGGAVALSAPMLPISIDRSYDSLRSIDGDLLFRPPRTLS